MPTGAVAFTYAHFGTGTGPIYLDDVACSGSEDSLIECSRSPFVSCSSGHWEDAGVRCQGNTYMHIIQLQVRYLCTTHAKYKLFM